MKLSKTARLAAAVFSCSLFAGPSSPAGAKGPFDLIEAPAAAPVTQKKVADATAAVAKATGTLNAVIAKARAQFEASPAFVGAQNALKAAKAACENSKGPALAALLKAPAYEAALAEKRKADAARDAVVNDPKATAGDRMNSINAVLRAGTGVSKLEADALATAPQVAAANAKVTEASNAVAALRREFDDSLKGSPEVEAARKELEQAEASLKAARTELAAATAADAAAQRQAAAQANSQGNANDATATNNTGNNTGNTTGKGGGGGRGFGGGRGMRRK